MSLGKDKLNAIEVLICKTLVDLDNSQDKFVFVNNMLRKYNEMKEEIKDPKTSAEYII